jgi:N-formylglutamate amidohydrolase
MSDVFTFVAGDAPLLISVPHDGRELAPGMAGRMTDPGKDLPDTDWHVRRLYAFADALGASILTANYSRYVVDLNRPASDRALYAGQLSTGLCPARTFDGAAIYVDGAPVGEEEQASRVQGYWQPYHDRLAHALDDIRGRHGYAVLWDAHSIAGEVPALFEGALPDLNIGTNGAESCAASVAAAVRSPAEASEFTWVLDGRFRGGHITRHYGRPADGIHAVQLELAQRTYMDESSRAFDDALATRLQKVIRQMLEGAMTAASSL